MPSAGVGLRILNAAADRLLVVLVMLVVGAGAILVVGPESAPRPEREMFQDTVGGLGAGTAVHPERCGRAFDGRIAPFCSWRHGAVEGADVFCPLHGPAVGAR